MVVCHANQLLLGKLQMMNKIHLSIYTVHTKYSAYLQNLDALQVIALYVILMIIQGTYLPFTIDFQIPNPIEILQLLS